jgi:hypothetical protein
MASTQFAAPAPNCSLCMQLGHRVPATSTVFSEARDYLACDEHAPWIAAGGFHAARLRATFTTQPKGAV